MHVTVVRLHICYNIANTLSFFYTAGHVSPMFKAEMFMYVYVLILKSDHRDKGCIRKDGSLYVLIR